MKILSSPVLEKNKKSSQLERLKTQGAKAFATASAYGCGRNPIDMRKLQQTGQTPAFVSLSSSSCGDLR